jgi:hypothetical protein
MKMHQKRLLDKGKIEKLVLSLRSTDSTNPEVIEKIRIEADYFEKMPRACATQSFAASICLSARASSKQAAKPSSVHASKQSGMFRTVRGANAIIALRCCHLNNRFEDYWESRRAA